MNAKNTKKSPIHENSDAKITCDFGDSDISRSRSRLPHTHTHTHTHTDSHTVSSIIVRLDVACGNPREGATACSMRETRETALLHACVQSSAASAHCIHIHIFNKVAVA